jgi:DNA-binding transcriptional ArsR family regulator
VITDAADLFRLLGDPTRLRLLRVLGRDRFNVTELTGILGLAQSGVSRHLGLLREAGLVVEEREAGYAFYRLADRSNGHAALWPLLEAQFATSADDRAVRADEATATSASSCRAAVGRHGRERSDICSRRSTLPILAAVRVI